MQFSIATCSVKVFVKKPQKSAQREKWSDQTNYLCFFKVKLWSGPLRPRNLYYFYFKVFLKIFLITWLKILACPEATCWLPLLSAQARTRARSLILYWKKKLRCSVKYTRSRWKSKIFLFWSNVILRKAWRWSRSLNTLTQN